MKTTTAPGPSGAPSDCDWGSTPLRLRALGPPRVAVVRVVSALSLAALAVRLLLDSGLRDIDILLELFGVLALIPLVFAAAIAAAVTGLSLVMRGVAWYCEKFTGFWGEVAAAIASNKMGGSGGFA